MKRWVYDKSGNRYAYDDELGFVEYQSPRSSTKRGSIVTPVSSPSNLIPFMRSSSSAPSVAQTVPQIASTLPAASNVGVSASPSTSIWKTVPEKQPEISPPDWSPKQQVLLQQLLEGKIDAIANAVKQVEAQLIAQESLGELMITPKPNVIGANVTATEADRVGGWLRPSYLSIIESGVIAVALDNSARASITTGPLRHSYGDFKSFYDAAQIASQGSAAKIQQSADAAAGVPTVVTLNGATFFGVILRFQYTQIGSNYKPFTISLAYGGETLVVLISPYQAICEIVLLLPSNNAGIGVLKTITEVVATIAADKVVPGSVISLESLNLRDI